MSFITPQTMTPLYDSTITSIFSLFSPLPPPPFVISTLQAHPKDLAHRKPVVGVNINIQYINPGIVFPRDRQSVNRLTVSKFTMSLNDLNPGAFNKP